MHIGKKANYEQLSSYVTEGDNQLRQYTITDYSRKTKVGTHIEHIDYGEAFREYREELRQRLFDVPASYALPEYEKFVVPVNTSDEYEWDVAMVNDEGVQTDELRRMVVHCERKVEGE